MTKTVALAILLALLCAAGASAQTATATATATSTPTATATPTATYSVAKTEVTFSSAKEVVFTWTSSGGGAADATTTAAFDGKLVGFATIPSGSAAPTDNYDVAIVDSRGHDVLMGAGANRDTANTEYVAEASLAAVAASKLTLHVTNAGDSKAGTVVVWIR